MGTFQDIAKDFSIADNALFFIPAGVFTMKTAPAVTYTCQSNKGATSFMFLMES